MHKKILGICMALVALGALAIGPASASAATHLADTSGGVTTTLAVGTKIKGISTGTAIFKAGSLEVKCNENYMTGEVTKNAGGQVQATITKAAFDSNLTTSATDCSSSLGATRVTIPALENSVTKEHWCIQNEVEKDIFNVFGRNCTAEGNGTLTFKLDVTGVVECAYKRTAAVQGEGTTPTEHKTSTLTVTTEPEFVRETENVLCPTPGFISKNTMAFDLYTDLDGTTTSSTEAERTAKWNDAASTAAPVWLEK